MKEILGVADIETISKLADIVNDKELSEITINANGGSITIKGKKPLPVPPPVMAVPPVPQAVQTAPQQPAEVPAAKAKEEINGGNIVKSPIVGTYYRSPSPDKPPFVASAKLLYHAFSLSLNFAPTSAFRTALNMYFSKSLLKS